MPLDLTVVAAAREFFCKHSGTGTLSQALRKMDPENRVAWESVSVSVHSPGVVGRNEVLARQVLDPAFFDASTGRIKPTLFDDASSRGASVNRVKHAPVPKLHELGRARALSASAHCTVPKTYIGFVHLDVVAVRSIAADGDQGSHRAFGVYDTALKSDCSHADICQLVSGRATGRSVRSRLYQLSKNTLCLASE